jgi:hypothetical protein
VGSDAVCSSRGNGDAPANFWFESSERRKCDTTVTHASISVTLEPQGRMDNEMVYTSKRDTGLDDKQHTTKTDSDKMRKKMDHKCKDYARNRLKPFRPILVPRPRPGRHASEFSMLSSS